MIRRCIGVLSLSTIVLCTILAGASVAAPQDVANDISQHVMSPFCPGVTLHDCPSDNAIELRAQIAKWSAGGMSKQQIMDRLIAQYGETIRAEPATSGTGLLAWVLPGVAVAIGVVIASIAALRWSRRRPIERHGAVVATALHKRVEAELAELREKL
jgi:cytochrome c-type biogenesis protein CcmH/NrfF